MWATGAAIVAAAALPSCGADDGGEGDMTRAQPAPGPPPQVVVRRFYAALGRGDGRTVCALMIPAAQEAMKEQPEGRRARSCAHAVALLARAEVALRDVETSTRPAYDSGVVRRRTPAGWRMAFPPGLITKFDSPPGIEPHDGDEQNGGSRG